MKILFLDIETAPSLVHCWGLWQQNVAINQIIKPGYTLCYAAKWLGEDEVIFDSIYQTKPKRMFKKLLELMDEADAIVHYNGDRFDIPTINKDFLSFGLLPPSPAKQIDLLKTVKYRFKFPSNKLDYVSQALGLGKKVKHEGHELWIGCMENDESAWSRMKAYNIQDVLLLEKLYEKIKPWIKNHANASIHSDHDGIVCPVCGGSHYHKRGTYKAKSSTYQRFVCRTCGHWFRDSIILNRKQHRTTSI